MTAEQDRPSRPPGQTPPVRSAQQLVPLTRNRDFQVLWTSRFLAGLGKESGEIAYPLLALLLAESAAQAGVIGAAQVTTAMITAVLGGSLADRANRRTVLLCCDLGRLALLSLFTVLLLTGNVTFTVIVGVAVGSAALMGVSNPVAMASVKQLVPASQMAEASAQNQIRLFSTTALGGPFAGTLFGVGRAFPFAAEALAYLVSAALVLLIRRPMQAHPTDVRGPWTPREAVSGFTVLARHPILRPMIAWIVGFNLTYTQTGAFLALIATAQSQGASHLQIGLTVSLAGSGGLLGAFCAGAVVRRVRPSAIFLVAAWAAPVCALGLLFAPNVMFLGALVGCVFAIVPCVNAVFHGYVAVSVSDRYQGRVLGAVTFMALVSQPVGILGIGVIFDHAGPAWVFLTMALVSALAALFSLSPVMRDLPRPEEVAVA
ncbi:MFS transporter [Nocardiopsis dassonvillei]|uniref:MFS transporter n=1 Tax=Nocardiopsis dassonvillei TaxID=2014 RepID=UPI00102CF88E|nr:MFS transporter [Nocardiopsis dassonvillei]MCP3015407.1 MFS transporter [Nocardiopsis dassonvillei]